MRISFIIMSSLLAISVANNLNAAIFGPDFDGQYIDVNIGTPTGVPGPLGGLTLLAGDPNTLLIGGNANNYNGQPGGIYSIGLTRGAGGHITGFSGTATLYADAPFIDGGLAYGPGNVLFFTRYPSHQIGQIKPGSSEPDRLDVITGVGANGNSVGSLMFVPPGFGGAGSLKILTFQHATFGTLPLSPDGSGTFNLGLATPNATLSGGPEGIAYVAAGSYGFAVDSMLVSEYTNSKVAAYEIDAQGNPLAATRRDFLTGLTNVEGAFIDPLTGDFLFSTFHGGNVVYVIKGFVPPPDPALPEPASFVIWLEVAVLGAAVCRQRLRQVSSTNVG